MHLERPLAAFVLICFSQIAHAQPSRLGTQVWIEDASGHALDALHRGVERARGGGGRVRLLFWGASHTASDQYTGPLRAEWQRRFGDAGIGFVVPAQPFLLFDHRQAIVGPQGSWRSTRVLGRSRERGMYGPAGIALDADRPARASIELARGVAPCDSIAFHYLRQPRGGTIEIALAPSGARRIVSTASTNARTEVLTLRAPGAIRSVTLSARGDGPVRIFGASLERDRSGVVIDSLGIPGARMRDRLPWDDASLRAQLEALAPDLIVLAYGTNESGAHDRAIEAEQREMDEAVRRARSAAPNASCLLIGPSDWPARSPEGGFVARARTAQIVRIQRETAARYGCGFFDLVAFTGGPGSMPRWVDAGLALGDYVHFTDEGYRILARVLSRALLRGIE